MSNTITIDGHGPLAVHRPASVDELSALVRETASQGQAIYPVGGGTMLDLGMPPSKPGVAVDLRSLDQVIDYPARDMTITVRAGITIEKLQAILAREGQRLPVDVPFAGRATVGGAIACNASGPRRFGYGTFRDYVIGIRVTNADGVETKAGGQVVKNVAGYDLCKLHIGALGTLGIITQVTLKVRPVPERTTIAEVRVDSWEQLEAVLSSIHASKTRPVMVTATSPSPFRREPPASSSIRDRSHAPENEKTVLIGFEGSQEALDWQINQLADELQSGGVAIARSWLNEQAEPVWTALTDFPLTPDRVTFKANLLPHAVPEFCRNAGARQIDWMAHAENGIVYGHLPNGSTQESAARCFGELRGLAVAVHGNLIVTRCPSAWKRSIAVWGEPRGDRVLMETVRKQLDPGGALNAGRMNARS